MAASISVAKEWFVSMSEGRRKDAVARAGSENSCLKWVDKATYFCPELVKFLAEELYIFVGYG